LGVKFFSIFVLFFTISSVFLFYKKSKTLVLRHTGASAPLMEFRDITSYNITFNGIDTILKAKSAKRYRTRDELHNIFTIKRDRGIEERLWADKGILRRSVLRLVGNVKYEDALSRTLLSDTVVYNIKKDILSSNTAFVSKYNNSVVKGSSFVYYLKLKRLYAKNIKAEIYMEK